MNKIRIKRANTERAIENWVFVDWFYRDYENLKPRVLGYVERVKDGEQ